MKKILFILCLIAFQNANSQDKILRTLVYSKGGSTNDTRIVTLKEGNIISWYSTNGGWKVIPMTGLPESKIVDMEYVQKVGMMDLDTRIIVMLEDKSLWWYAEGKSWENIPLKGLPEDKGVVDFAACIKVSTAMMGSGLMPTTRLVVTLDDNSIWYCAPSAKDSEWKMVE